MKVFILIILMSVTGLAQAYSVIWDLKGSPDFKDYTFAEGEDIVTWGVDNSLGEGASITYSFSDESYSCGSLDNCSPIQSADYQAIISDAFDAWAEVANLSFSQVEAQAGDIVVAYSNIPNVEIDGTNYNILGVASVGVAIQYNVESEKVMNSYLSNNGIFFDIKDFDAGSSFSLFSVALHEVGHALGLGHSSELNSIMYPEYSSVIGSLQDDDIDGIQYLYGASLTYGSVTAVPEPSSYLLVLLGMAMVVGVSRRRKGSSLECHVIEGVRF